MVLPPGAGKTLLGMWALERERRAGEAGLVVLPRLPLIDQTLAAYRRSWSNGTLPHILVVASDCARPLSAAADSP